MGVAEGAVVDQQAGGRREVCQQQALQGEGRACARGACRVGPATWVESSSAVKGWLGAQRTCGGIVTVETGTRRAGRQRAAEGVLRRVASEPSIAAAFHDKCLS
jgi:hypothetical protein